MTQSPADDDGAVNCPGNNWGRGTLRANPGAVDRAREPHAARAARLGDQGHASRPTSVWPQHARPEERAATLVEPTQAGDGLPERHPRHPGLDLLAGKLRLPDPRLRLGSAVRRVQRDRHSDERAAADQGAWSRCMVPASMRTATSSAACRPCCAMRRSARISAGTSPPARMTLTYDGRPFHAGQVCNYVGGMVPFADHEGADRIATNDPRLSLRGALWHARRLRRRGARGRQQRRVRGLSERGRDRRVDGRAVHDARCRPGVADDWAHPGQPGDQQRRAEVSTPSGPRRPRKGTARASANRRRSSAPPSRVVRQGRRLLIRLRPVLAQRRPGCRSPACRSRAARRPGR